MDPDVAHPRHQSNQTVRNRGVGVVGGQERGGGSLSPACRAAFFLRWSRTKPHHHTTTFSRSNSTPQPPHPKKIDPWHLKWWENAHTRDLCKLQAHRDTFHFLWWHAWMRNGNIPARRGDILLMFPPEYLTIVCADSGFQSVCSSTSRGLFNSVQVHLIYPFTYTTEIIS